MLKKEEVKKILKKSNEYINFELFKYGIIDPSFGFYKDGIKYKFNEKRQFMFNTKNDRNKPRTIKFNHLITLGSFLLTPHIKEKNLLHNSKLYYSFSELKEKHRIEIINDMMEHNINLSFVEDYYLSFMFTDNTTQEYNEMGLNSRLLRKLKKINTYKIISNILGITDMYFEIEEKNGR